MLNSTLQSTKSGGPLAGAWAVVTTIGDDGYLALTEQVLEGVDRIVAGVEQIAGLRVVVRPDSTLVAIATDETCDVFTITDAMTRAGWYVQPQLSFAGRRPTIHLSVSAATTAHVEEFLTALRAAAAEAVAAGPIAIDPGVVELVQALDPRALSEEDFDGLLAAVGMAGGDGVGLPESMAEINALLDLAVPDLREALLTAFLDRLQRPV
jgi:sphinganine-1-phosphate aldolase